MSAGELLLQINEYTYDYYDYDFFPFYVNLLFVVSPDDS